MCLCVCVFLTLNRAIIAFTNEMCLFNTDKILCIVLNWPDSFYFLVP